MKTDVTTNELYHAVRSRYPNAQLYFLDEEYELPTREMIEVAYKKFEGSLWKWNVFKWISNKWDCDKFAWAFKASVSVGNALSKNNNAQPVGFLCYLIDGKQDGGHAINMAIIEDGDGFEVIEIEPQPKNGITELSKKERESVWLVII